MRLKEVKIVNFRSIKDLTISFDTTCRGLVGINESGKTNILKALALLSPDRNVKRSDDMREALPDEDIVTSAYVHFVFKFGKEDTDRLYSAVSSKILSCAKNPDVVSQGSINLDVKKYCMTRDEGLYDINVLTEKKRFTYWTSGSEYKLLPGWKKPSKACPDDFAIDVDGEKKILKSFCLVRTADFTTIPTTHLEVASIEDLTSLSGSEIQEIVEENLPEALLWEYDEQNLLPGKIKIAEFRANPSICVPLKNMFTLAGVTNINEDIEKARRGTDNQFQNYLNRIAKKTTNHFRAVWKEYRNVEFSLRLNADEIDPGIKEKNTHDFARRSDGFKRFVTFLLMISVTVKMQDLKDTLLLIDEPEIGLHPSGVRFLRDELIRISKTNYVVYSTHSIFMIDSGDVGRHYIVKKVDEVTNVQIAKDSNVADEEVLMNALGHSLFAILKEQNIIFEGWNDKQLFNVALENSTSPIKSKFRDAGICHTRGVSNIKAITPLIELAKRKCIIVSDSDEAAKKQQKQYREDMGFGSWKTYQEIDATTDATTGEDFIKPDIIAKHVRAAIAAKGLPAFPSTAIPAGHGKLSAISAWLTANGMSADQSRQTITVIKNNIFSSLKASEIADEYKKILNGITLS